MTCSKITFFTPRAPMLFAAGGRGALLVMPRPLSDCQIKAEIKGFLLRYRLFQYLQWFFHNLEASKILKMTSAPCTQSIVFVLFWYSEQFWYTTCSADVVSFWKRFTCMAHIQQITQPIFFATYLEGTLLWLWWLMKTNLNLNLFNTNILSTFEEVVEGICYTLCHTIHIFVAP